jgi:diketogulonate reductase-like aldo/keto reductase
MTAPRSSASTLALPTGEAIPRLGLGTWRMGEDRRRRAAEVAALRLGLELGLGLIDTAEMYGSGGAEVVVAEAIAGRRDGVFLVSKVLPQNASRRGTIAACEASLKRLATDRIDLYLLHWRGGAPLAETVAGFAALKQAGKIRHYGVSNFDAADMEELWALPEGAATATNQVLYNLVRRGVERELRPWCRKHRVPLMAYSPIEQAKLARDAKLADFAKRHAMTAAQAALGWLLANDDVMVIPKTGRRERLRENLGALERPLSAAQLAELDRLFPAPPGARPLEMI